jgi:hypothetical protein
MKKTPQEMAADAAESNGGAAKIVIIVLPIISGISLVLRLYTRMYITKKAGLEDALIVFSFVSLYRSHIAIQT